MTNLLEPSTDPLVPNSAAQCVSSFFFQGLGSFRPTEDELNNMLLAPLHPFANVRNIRKDSLLVSFSEALRGRDNVAL